MACTGCSLAFEDIIIIVKENDSKAIQIFSEHGVVPETVNCPCCGNCCKLQEDQNLFVCNREISDDSDHSNKRKRSCNFSISQFKDTWLEHVKAPPCISLRFINVFVRERLVDFLEEYCEENFDMCENIAVDCKSFASKVCAHWLDTQKPIGGDGVLVEIGMWKFGTSKHRQGRPTEGQWVLGGIEIESKKGFVFPVDSRSSDALLPLILRFVRPKSVIISDLWNGSVGHQSLGEGYTLYQNNHTRHIVENGNPGIHTENLKKIWKNMKPWTLRTRNKENYYAEYLSRFLFLAAHQDSYNIFHAFLKAIAKVYHHPYQQ